MRLLLDTHVVIWSVLDSKQLPESVRQHISNPANRCFVSMASLWEMSIKHSLGRLEFNMPLADMYHVIGESGFDLLPIGPSHLLHNATLAFHRQDPFDRLIIAQAFDEHMTVVTKDRKFVRYGVPLIWK
jgi:PIN domain nuclease of toxin-antitoxin system